MFELNTKVKIVKEPPSFFSLSQFFKVGDTVVIFGERIDNYIAGSNVYSCATLPEQNMVKVGISIQFIPEDCLEKI